MREAITSARRFVVKVGSSSLTSNGSLDLDRMQALVVVLADLRDRGCEVVLVSSGAIAAGLEPLGLRTRPRDLPTQQAAASVGQGLLIERYAEFFAARGITVAQVLVTVDDVTRRQQYRNVHRTTERLLELGALPIVNENDTVATAEIRFGDNDRLAALVAHLVHADALVLLSDVPGLYTAHPQTPGAERIPRIDDWSVVESVDISRRGSAVGTGGMHTKLDAARIAVDAGIGVVLTHADDARAALAGEDTGTYFPPLGRRRPTRLLWLAHISDAAGDLIVDAGAVHALTERGASLLPAGITSTRGQFRAGDPVNICAPDGRVIARGLVNYDAARMPDIIGRRTSELAATLGAGTDREVVHRDAMAVLD